MLPLSTYLKNPNLLGIALLEKFGSRILPDKLYLQWLYRLRIGEPLNLENPKRFTEKIQWLKLYNRKPEYTTMVDKYAVKQYVADKIGEEYIIPTLGVWDRPENIDFDSLPDKFVLKTTHGGGGSGVVICHDKSTFDREKAIAQLNRSLASDIYRTLKEWPYKNVPKRIIAEEYIEFPNGDDLCDYKFFCFNGEPKYCQVISGRTSTMSIDFFDKDWTHQPFHEPKNFPFAQTLSVKPVGYDSMIDLAQELALNTPFVRVDFYNIKGRIYFGEMTFYPTSGLGGFSPKEWDLTFGEMIMLPEKSSRGGGRYVIDLEEVAAIFGPRIRPKELFDSQFFCINGEPNYC